MTIRPSLFLAAASTLLGAGIAHASPASGPVNAWASETQAILEEAMAGGNPARPPVGDAVINVTVDASGKPVALAVVSASGSVRTPARASVEKTLADMPRLPASMRGKPVNIQFQLTYGVDGSGQNRLLTSKIAAKADAALAHNSSVEARTAAAAVAGAEPPAL